MAECTQIPTRVKIPVEIHYDEAVYLPGCSGAGYRENAVMTEVELDSYTSGQAPVALVVERCDPTYPMKEDPYRLVNGKLYCQASPRCEPAGFNGLEPVGACRALVYDLGYRLRVVDSEDLGFVPCQINGSVDAGSRLDSSGIEVHEEFLRGMVKELVLIDDELWLIAPEPCYKYDPDYGFMLSSGWHGDVDYHCNALEGETAESRAAIQGVDIDSGECDRIRVVIPEAVAMPTHGELCDMRCLAEALKHIYDAEEILDKLGGGTLDADRLTEMVDATVSTETAGVSIRLSLESMVRELEVRRQRGTVKLTEEELQDQIEETVLDLMCDGVVYRR